MVTARGSKKSVEVGIRSGLLACSCGGRCGRGGMPGPAGWPRLPGRRRCGRDGDLPRLRPVARAASGLAAVATKVRGAGDLRGAGVAGGGVEGDRGGRAAAAAAAGAGPGLCWSVPASTAGSWLSPVRRAGRAAAPGADAGAAAGRPQARPVAAAGSVTGDALAALAAVAAGCAPGFPGWTRWPRMRWPRT
jgi:hypothetical protein